MTPKEKAKELIDKFEGLEPTENYECSFIDKPMAKRCALIAVDEIITVLDLMEFEETGKVSTNCYQGFWNNVKEEINKI